jgi:hypothetical protein
MILILVVLVAAVALLAAGAKPKDGAGAYRQRKLMTENEREFFARLVKALPGHYIFPQVALSGLLEASSTSKQKAHSDRLRIAQQRADFVICDENCTVVAVIELDDRTHSAKKTSCATRALSRPASGRCASSRKASRNLTRSAQRYSRLSRSSR